MPKFILDIQATATVTTKLYIEANSLEEAISRSSNVSKNDHTLDWRIQDIHNDVKASPEKG